jgi:uncharacterized DUF497 family protein
MGIEFGPVKDAKNLNKHGVSLALAAKLDWDHAAYEADIRFSCDEIRMNAVVPLGNHLYHVTFTERGEKMRVISLRAATNQEKSDYVQDYR